MTEVMAETVHEHQEQQPVSELYDILCLLPLCFYPVRLLLPFMFLFILIPSLFLPLSSSSLPIISFITSPQPKHAGTSSAATLTAPVSSVLSLFYNCKIKTFFRAQKLVICASEAFNTVGSSDVLKLPHNETTALGLINNKDAKRDFLLKMLTGRENLVPLQRMTYQVLYEKANKLFSSASSQTLVIAGARLFWCF